MSPPRGSCGASIWWAGASWDSDPESVGGLLVRALGNGTCEEGWAIARGGVLGPGWSVPLQEDPDLAGAAMSGLRIQSSPLADN